MLGAQMLSKMGGLGQSIVDKNSRVYTNSRDFSKENLSKDKAKRDATAEKQISLQSGTLIFKYSLIWL